MENENNKTNWLSLALLSYLGIGFFSLFIFGMAYFIEYLYLEFHNYKLTLKILEYYQLLLSYMPFDMNNSATQKVIPLFDTHKMLSVIFVLYTLLIGTLLAFGIFRIVGFIYNSLFIIDPKGTVNKK